MKVLLLHDDDNVRGALTMMLSAAEYEVVATASADALALARRVRPTVIVVDYSRDPAKQTEVLSALRRELTSVVVVALLPTGFPRRELVNIARGAGLVRSLYRPFDKRGLLRAIGDALAVALRAGEPANRTHPDRLEDPFAGLAG